MSFFSFFKNIPRYVKTILSFRKIFFSGKTFLFATERIQFENKFGKLFLPGKKLLELQFLALGGKDKNGVIEVLKKFSETKAELIAKDFEGIVITTPNYTLFQISKKIIEPKMGKFIEVEMPLDEISKERKAYSTLSGIFFSKKWSEKPFKRFVLKL